jgi:DNA polymerase-3 subunit beta
MNIHTASTALAASLPVALMERAKLESALKFVSGTVERRTHIPILANARLRSWSGGLRIEATDMDMVACAVVPAAVDSRLDVTIPARMLLDTVKGQGSELIEMRPSQDTDSERVTLDFEGSQTVLNGLPAVDFPSPDEPRFTHVFTVPADQLRRLLDKTSFAISTEETRYYLNGVYLHAAVVEKPWCAIEGGGGRVEVLRCVATDGHRLARADAPLPEGAEGMPAVIVPRKAVSEAMRLIPRGTKRKPATDPVTVSVGPARVRFAVGGCHLCTKVIDGTFPDYQRVIPTDNAKRLRIERAPFAAAIQAVMTIQSERGRSVKLTIKDGMLEASVSHPEHGSSSRLVECEFRNPDNEIGFNASFEIGFNARYLLDILARCEAEVVTVAMGNSGSPALFFDKADGPELFVCMPMRV